METNCFFSKVKGVISNNHLPYLNGIKLNIMSNEYNNIYKLTLESSSPIEVRCGEDGYFAESVAGLVNDRIRTKTGTNITLYFPCLNFRADILGKDKIVLIDLEQKSSDGSSATDVQPLPIVNTSDLVGIGTLTELWFAGTLGGSIVHLNKVNVKSSAYVYVAFCEFSDITPRISNLPKGATYYYTQRSNIGGNIADIAELGVMNTLDCQNNITGSLEELVAAYQAKSLDNKNIQSIIPPINISWLFGTPPNSISVNREMQGKLAWNGDMISLICSRSPNDSKVYEKNATNEEITAWQEVGKTVTDVDTGTVYPPSN